MTDLEQEKKNSALEDLIDKLRQFTRAYPEDIFRPLTDEERKQMGSLLDRASAGMGRHFAQYFDKAADAIESLQRDLASARYDAETFKESHAIAKSSIERLQRELEEARRDAERIRELKVVGISMDVRADFEALHPWSDLEKNDDGTYKDYALNYQWIGFQAARQQKG